MSWTNIVTQEALLSEQPTYNSCLYHLSVNSLSIPSLLSCGDKRHSNQLLPFTSSSVLLGLFCPLLRETCSVQGISTLSQGLFGHNFFLFTQRMDTTLSDMKEKVSEAQCALPLFTCLHVKPDVSELMFAGMFSVCLWNHL